MKANINGIRIYYTESGNPAGLPVVFIHGFPFNSSMWTPQLKSISGKYRAITFDVRGHGESDFGDGQFLIEFFVDDLFGLLDYLKIEKAVLVGLSMGGYIALRAIERHPERVAALVLCDTKSAADTNEVKIRRARQIQIVKSVGIARFAEDFLKAIFSEETFIRLPSIVDMIRNIILKTSPLSVASTLIALAARTDTTRALPEIKVPTLIMVGERDTLTTPADALEVKNQIPNSEMHIIPNAAHMSNLENSSAFNKHLFDFLEKI
ncbi:MAG: alpha/beta fold hydrolase [Bacteroidota bacterium]|nr:alpha/beta fold hydrolase [Bacteroidota bacterium]